MYGTPPCIPGLVQTNITNSAEEKWALLDKDIEMEDSETEQQLLKIVYALDIKFWVRWCIYM